MMVQVIISASALLTSVIEVSSAYGTELFFSTELQASLHLVTPKRNSESESSGIS